ncbi:uncharacterized protein A4U43_C08F23550 [Asparagus officinalis]|uniref:protein DMR6-LIKE OXYGENASE 2-like n=1 Tax=Asparagus officinalis TaxID=4686 RepID=UPI00098E68EF|nr:protein DMR6-LIKE OXYGENASE 2-like [Asparagus officinalis]ONK60868.1 uncharacterized protein A4U43_C08F23550 [Asparagus officinalis]
MASPNLLGPPQNSSTIKELSSSGALSSLPSLYASKAHELESVVEDGQIPVVDFSLLTAGSPEKRSQMIRELGKACEEWGFFMLVNHGVPEKFREGMMDALKGFFDLTEEEKKEYADTHVLNPIRYGTSFNTAKEDVRYWRDYLKVTTHPEFVSPTKPDGFSETLEEFCKRTRGIAWELLKGIWESLGLEENSIKEALGYDSSWQIFVGNIYPPCPQPDLAVGLPPHSDHGLLSILYQDGTVDGLEVKHDGKWVRVMPLPNSFLINTGDHTEIVTNGKYKSVLHRAVVNGTNTRMSIVAAVGPSMDAVVVPAPALVSSESPATFRGISFREYAERQQGNKLKDKSVLDFLRL